MDAEMNRQKELAEKTTIKHYLTNNYEKDISDRRHQRDNQVTPQKYISPLLTFNLDGTGEDVRSKGIRYYSNEHRPRDPQAKVRCSRQE